MQTIVYKDTRAGACRRKNEKKAGNTTGNFKAAATVNAAPD